MEASNGVAPAGLAGHVALVTGVTRNMGKAVAFGMVPVGADIAVVTGSSPEKAEQVIETCSHDFGVRAIALVADIASADDVARSVGEIIARLGKVDIAVQCAAVRPHAAIEDISVDDWCRVIDTNPSAAFFAKALLPGMRARKRGRFTHVSSSSGFFGYPNRAHSFAAKEGLHGFTKALASETAADMITMNTIVPGVFRTEREAINYPGWSDEKRAAAVPVGRLGEPSEFADLAVVLASGAAGYITGQAIHLNDGQWMI
jgi:NAD(P)-dependent dehydrogenase (short-subunit alcohol dehydrogenase family)